MISEAWAANPGLVLKFYNQRRRAVRAAEPNAAHRALVDLERAYEVRIITQNVDDLHERAGSHRVLHMHGQLRSAWCLACDDRSPWQQDLAHGPACPSCGSPALRPDVVWFGEIPYGMRLIEDALLEADLFVSIGTSSLVYPAAGFVRMARMWGARTLELNLDPSAATSVFDEARHGCAGELVPAWVDELLGSVRAT